MEYNMLCSVANFFQMRIAEDETCRFNYRLIFNHGLRVYDKKTGDHYGITAMRALSIMDIQKMTEDIYTAWEIQ